MSEVTLRSLFSYLPSMRLPVLSEEMVIMIMDQLCITTAQAQHSGLLLRTYLSIIQVN